MEDESNPWPSFVDTFSTVLCIFIFLMLVFALNNMLVVYDNSIKAYKNAVVIAEDSDKKQDGATKDKLEVIEPSKDAFFGKDVGTFDIASGDNVEITISDKGLTIIYPGNISSYSKTDIEKIVSWANENKSKQFGIEIYVPQLNLSYSDRLRMGYERGIILMKEIKSSNPSLNFNLNINTEFADAENKAVITKEN